MERSALWMDLKVAAARLGISSAKLGATLAKHAHTSDDGVVVAEMDGVMARKFGRFWRVCLSTHEQMPIKAIDRSSDSVTMAPRETRAVRLGIDMASNTTQSNVIEKKQRKSSGVREEMRRGKRYLVIDFRYRIPDGSRRGKSARFRHDAEVQTWQGARDEHRRRLVAVTRTGSPFEIVDPVVRAQVVPEPEPESVGFTFGQAIDEWSADYLPTVKASTQRSFLQVADYRFTRFQGVPLVKVGAEQWRTVQAAIRGDGCCEGTVKAAGVVYRSILRFAVERKRIERMPELPPLPRNATTELVTYTDDEVRALLAACRSKRHRIAVLLICYAGLRTSEVRGLRSSDMDPHARMITVRQAITLGPKKPNGGTRLVKDKPKGKNERTIPMTEEIYQELLALGPLKPNELVCPNKDGKPWGHKGLYELWTRLRKRAGVRRVARPVHAGRHYFGTALCRARSNPRSVQKLLGHSNLATTERYVHAVERDLVTAIEDLEALVMKAPATTRRPMLQPSGADVERSAESERRPILSSRGDADRDVESERRPTIDMGAAQGKSAPMCASVRGGAIAGQRP